MLSIIRSLNNSRTHRLNSFIAFNRGIPVKGMGYRPERNKVQDTPLWSCVNNQTVVIKRR
jgi:hypothetical protein